MDLQEIKALAGHDMADYAHTAASEFRKKANEAETEEQKQYNLYQHEQAMTVYYVHTAEYWANAAEEAREASWYEDDEREFEVRAREIDAETYRSKAELRWDRAQHHRRLWRAAR